MQFAENGSSDVSLLNFDDTIGEGLTFASPNSYGLFSEYISSPPTTSGNFIDTTGYAGFELTDGPDIYCGWMQLTVANYNNPSITATIIDWAYQDSPGTAIAAGDIGSVPEPSSWAMLVSGAGLLFLLHRRAE